jgi:hypothetical protein
MNLRTLWWLNQWFVQRKYNNITKRYPENKYAVENRDSEPFI